MDVPKADRSVIRAGFLLLTLALVTGLAVPIFLNHRMAVAAHVGGVLNALLLIVLGLSWGLLTVSLTQARFIRAAFLYGAYASWGSASLAAAWGTNRLTPIAGAGFGAAPWKEVAVQTLQMSVAFAMLAGAVSVVYALRSTRRTN